MYWINLPNSFVICSFGWLFNGVACFNYQQPPGNACHEIWSKFSHALFGQFAALQKCCLISLKREVMSPVFYFAPMQRCSVVKWRRGLSLLAIKACKLSWNNAFFIFEIELGTFLMKPIITTSTSCTECEAETTVNVKPGTVHDSREEQGIE